jgi:hypothetical protein
MDHYSRRIIGFGIHAGTANGEALCWMFKQTIRGVTIRSISVPTMIRCTSFINGKQICRVLDIEEIKTVPEVPWSHPFIERLIGTIRFECLDQGDRLNRGHILIIGCRRITCWNDPSWKQRTTASRIGGSLPDVGISDFQGKLAIRHEHVASARLDSGSKLPRFGVTYQWPIRI